MWCQCTGSLKHLRYLVIVCLPSISFFPQRAMPLCQVVQQSSDCLVQRHKFWLHEDVVWRTIRSDCWFWDLRTECRSDLVIDIALWHCDQNCYAETRSPPMALAYSDFNQTPLIQHIYPPHHVVRTGMLDSQQSGRTSNWRAGPVVPAKNLWLQMVGFREEWRCPSCHSAASTFLYCQDPSPVSVWPYSPYEWVAGC